MRIRIPVQKSAPAQQPAPPALAMTMTQRVALVIFVCLVLTLIVWPELGVRLFWNLVIPMIPALCVFAPGWWRNACPLATLTWLGKRLPWATERMLSLRAQGLAASGSVALLVLLLPLRRLVFDLDGRATAGLVLGLAFAGLLLSASFARKSGWCAGWCPVAAAERLYGQAPLSEGRNARCVTCTHCVALCPDSVRNLTLAPVMPTRWHRAADVAMAGGFLGYVWGWFQVPDRAAVASWQQVAHAYALPLAGAVATLALFVLVDRWTGTRQRARLVRTFAAATVCCYYAYRLPALFGFAHISGDGVLVNWSATLPDGFPWACRAVTTTLFGTWLLGGRGATRWLTRPRSAMPA